MGLQNPLLGGGGGRSRPESLQEGEEKGLHEISDMEGCLEDVLKSLGGSLWRFRRDVADL